MTKNQKNNIKSVSCCLYERLALDIDFFEKLPQKDKNGLIKAAENALQKYSAKLAELNDWASGEMQKQANTREGPCRGQSRRQSTHCAERTANNRQGSKSKSPLCLPISTEKTGGDIRPKFAKIPPQFGNAKQRGKILRELDRAALSPYSQSIPKLERQVLRLLQTIDGHVLPLTAALNGAGRRHGRQYSRNRKNSSK